MIDRVNQTKMWETTHAKHLSTSPTNDVLKRSLALHSVVLEGLVLAKGQIESSHVPDAKC